MGKAIVMSNVKGKFDTTPTESKTTGTVGNFPHGSRETPETSVSSMETDRSEKARGHKSDMHITGESHSSIVPEKPANKGGVLERSYPQWADGIPFSLADLDEPLAFSIGYEGQGGPRPAFDDPDEPAFEIDTSNLKTGRRIHFAVPGPRRIGKCQILADQAAGVLRRGV